ncbi:MAG: DUF4276 family protein [Bryobacterales bacterium]|nr:DUF4276 family protein [Bryobacterales bacterium]
MRSPVRAHYNPNASGGLYRDFIGIFAADERLLLRLVPGRRLAAFFNIAKLASYSKVRQGPLIAEAIGIDAMRAACPRFRAWTGRIAAWAPQIP